MHKYLDIFAKEAEEHLASLQAGLLELETRSADPHLIHDLLRNAHTLKGSAKMMGFDDIASISHRMEDLLKEMEEGGTPVDAAGINLLLKGTDAVERMVAALLKGEDSSIDPVRFLECFNSGVFPEESEPVEPEPAERESGSGSTVRTKVETLDKLVSFIGEFIINKKRLEEKLSRLKTLADDTEHFFPERQLSFFHRDLEEDIIHQGYLIEELQGLAMGLRMLPLSTVTGGLRRMVRDLALEQGKEVDFVISGEGIEIDRAMLESLKPALLHILRNAVDHGVEAPAERAAAGKPAKAMVRLGARHEANSIRIDVRDDGRGMDVAKIREAAVKRGLVSREEEAELKDEEILYLTLRPGFSTREKVTDVSGRGVGMDVVKEKVEAVKGNLLLKSEAGRFTEITLFVPLTLSIVEALVVSCCGESYAVPLTYVQETLKLRREAVLSVAGKDVVAIRGKSAPLMPLAALLGLPEKRITLPQGETISAVVLRFRDQFVACTVDECCGSSEIVVKGLGEQFKRVEFVSGATILGDGDPALILNVPDLFARLDGVAGSPPGGLFAEGEEAERPSILVVDDSITTRTMERSILVSHGYDVEVAVSGEDALEKTAARRFDLVVTDIEMPGMNGFELTAQLGQTDTYRDVPVIVVSSLSRDEDKRKALEAGARAYIVKGSFDQGTLLETVEELIG